MRVLTIDDWHLMNGVERNKKNPDTFHIPSEEEKDKVVVGQHVKLGWETDLESQLSGERMWVIVTSIDGTNYTGTLDNDPAVVPLDVGAVLKFTRDNIISIWEGA